MHFYVINSSETLHVQNKDGKRVQLWKCEKSISSTLLGTAGTDYAESERKNFPQCYVHTGFQHSYFVVW